jgi:cytochrome b561
LNAKPRPARWSELTILLHWAAGAIILALIVLGWVMVYGGLDAAARFDLYQWHKSFGFVALAFTAARLAARYLSIAPSAPPSPLWERRLAALTQAALYALTIVVIVAGWLLVSASPLPIPTRFFNLFVIPNIAGPDPSLFSAAVLTHKLAAWLIVFLVALHVAGALKHHFANCDDVLMRMLPPSRRADP